MPSSLNRRLPRINASRFSMVPRADVPRSTFVTQHALKTTFNAGYLVPIELAEVLPGDVHQGRVTIFARLHNLLFPLMDNVTLETFFFFVPNRLVWDNWVKMMGERTDPADSISYTVPQISLPTTVTTNDVGELYDYYGVPLTQQLTGNEMSVNALPFRGYNFIWNEWFRDQNLQDSLDVSKGNGPDTDSTYVLMRRNKKHDYFTSALPWPLKGGVEVSLPLGGQALVHGIGTVDSAPIDAAVANVREADGATTTYPFAYRSTAENILLLATAAADAYPFIYADLSTATGATINALRLAIQTQRLLERDARSGTRYTELLRAHFGVTPEDSRLQRPEYIGGGRTNFTTQAIPQTSATGLTGGTSPLGALTGQATATDQHSYSYHATEHGFIHGFVHVTADVTYQQGLARHFTRTTRYDYYWPVFAHLGEQVIRNDEIYAVGTDSQDQGTFGYQERWAEYRHRPSRITGLFRSNATGNIDEWHLAQQFTALPVLNTSFIEDAPPFVRVLAAGAAANNMQVLFDSVFRIRSTRPLPMFSVPGMMDHF